MIYSTMQSQFWLTWDFIGVSGAFLKIFKASHYGFAMLSHDLILSHTCYSYVSETSYGFATVKKWKMRDPESMNKRHQKLYGGLFTRLLTGFFASHITDVSLWFHIIPFYSVTGNEVTMH